MEVDAPGRLEDSRSSEETVAGVRERRSNLHSTLVDLEQAIASAAPRRTAEWRHAVHTALERLATRFADHVASTEGPGGLFESVRQRAPRLDHACRRLKEEHAEIQSKIAAARRRLDDDPESVRDAAMSLLTLLARHRQRGADLVYEAYDVDLGGSD
ncbi:MAG: hypothetical protein ACRDU8_03640 [Egibacteraceae bacterium]